MKNLDTNYTRGMIAEFYALGFLLMKGYRLRAWRYKTPVGEVDLVMQRGKTLVFVEVKLRPSRDEALAAVTPVMRRRIARAAQHFMAHQPQRGAGGQEGGMRFDVVAVAGLRLMHLDNAWFAAT